MTTKDCINFISICSDNRIKSFGKLARSCKVDNGVKWILGGIELDFRNTSDFRKDKIGSIKN